MKLIGIGGTDGAGKDTVAEMLVDKYGWQFVSVSDILRSELTQQGIELKRENLRRLSAKWRREFGLGVLIDKAVALYDGKSAGLVISSLRNYGEVEEIHKLGGFVVWVDAEPQVRYKRIISRQRGREDQVSYEEFLAEEKAQMHHEDSHHSLNLSGVKEKADLKLENNNDIDSFVTYASKSLAKYL